MLGQSSLLSGSMTQQKKGIDGRYNSIRDIKEPVFQRDLQKNEANILPDRGSTIKIAAKKEKQIEENPYEKQISARMQAQPDETSNCFPKVTFAAQQVFNEVCTLSAKVPTWSHPSQNPINIFVPEAEQSYKSTTDEKLQEEKRRGERAMKLSTLAGKERTLQLAGTMALKNRKMSPIEKLRQTRGMVTIKRVPDVFETKNALA